MVTSGKRFNGLCCFDYGNAETDNADDGDGTMEAIYFGNAHCKVRSVSILSSATDRSQFPALALATVYATDACVTDRAKQHRLRGWALGCSRSGERDVLRG